MTNRTSRFSPALKHGGYSAMSVLPGEDAAAFKNLHEDLIADFNPLGPFEDDVVKELAHLLWRKQNLSIYKHASRAREIVITAVFEAQQSMDPISISFPHERKGREIGEKTAQEKLEKEYGANLDVIQQLGGVDDLLRELSVLEKLNGMIHQCLKRLLHVRGMKSIAVSPSIPRREPKQLSAS